MDQIKTKDTDYKKLVEPYKEECLNTLKELIAIPSMHDENTKTENKPFGEEVDKALAYVASLGRKMGFKVDRCDGYLTELTCGEGEKTLDIYGHIDVVPASDKGWTTTPFQVRIDEEGIMYGRGVADDKGPAIACLYALKALKDRGGIDGVRIRYLFGGNEEGDSLCLEHYFHTLKREYPEYGFSPDSDFPLIYAEKSIYAYKASYDVDLKCNDFVLGGTLNIVINEASITIEDLTEEDKINVQRFADENKDIRIEINGKSITIFGKPAHGSTPWKGVNAGLYILKLLSQVRGVKLGKEIFDYYSSGKGESFSGNFKDEDFDCTSYNVGKIVYANHKLDIYVNFRFPSSMEVEEIIPVVSNGTKAEIVVLGGSKGFKIDKGSNFIRTLLSAYQEETGDTVSKPLAIGGGTYARESRNSVAFGAQFPGRDYKMHGYDEFFPLSDFYANMQIYASAIDKLVKMIKEER